MADFVVLGAGAWGTAIAVHLASNGHQIHLWDRDEKKLLQMQATRINTTYLPTILLPPSITIYTNLKDCINHGNNFFIAVPSHGFVRLLTDIAPQLKKNSLIAWGTKGLIHGKFLHFVASDCLGDDYQFVAISGPSFAKEVALGLPTAVTFASNVQEYAEVAAKLFHSKTFRPYVSTDLLGVEIGGVVKNIIAIAVGISDGLGFGANARAALITRGLSEMTQLGLHLGGKVSTFYGLAGVGDLILTATDNQSRNRRFGIALGEGLTIDAAKKKIGQVVEGARNSFEVFQLAQAQGIEMPICEQVYRVLYQSLPPSEAVANLLQREMKAE